MRRNPHPARRARIATFGISTIALISIVSSMTANAHQADLAAADDLAVNTVDVVTPISAPTQTSTPSATPAVVNPEPSKSSQPTTKKTKPKKTATPATPSKSSKPKTSSPKPATPTKSSQPTTAPTKPAATVVYTCMSPGGKTENPTSSGKCKNAKYGYVLTKI
jgi:outer membrane biosynthesis protein TonB